MRVCLFTWRVVSLFIEKSIPSLNQQSLLVPFFFLKQIMPRSPNFDYGYLVSFWAKWVEWWRAWVFVLVSSGCFSSFLRYIFLKRKTQVMTMVIVKITVNPSKRQYVVWENILKVWFLVSFWFLNVSNNLSNFLWKSILAKQGNPWLDVEEPGIRLESTLFAFDTK